MLRDQVLEDHLERDAVKRVVGLGLSHIDARGAIAPEGRREPAV
jgi:hypothetical protein